MTDLVEFLFARIAGDEADLQEPSSADYCDALTGAHYSNERVRAECDAKRRIIDAYRAAVIDEQAWSRQPDSHAYHQAVARVSAWIYALTSLALPYADHPDYRDEWPP